MKRIVAIAVLFLAAVPANARTIIHDLGGSLYPYIFAAMRSTDSGETIRIDGICASACTAFLLNPKTCATPRAVLMFHSANQESATEVLWTIYPDKVRKRLGKLTPDLVSVRGLDLLPACSGKIN